MEKRTKAFIFFLIIVSIIGIIFLIKAATPDNNQDEQTIKCIAEKSKLFVSKTCGACASQKQILGEYLDYFEIIDCTTNYEECASNNILYVPTWIINGKKEIGVKTISKLKELTNC